MWRTDAPAYAGRSLGLGPSWVVIGRGDAGPAVYVLRDVERLPLWRGRSYLIRYTDGEGELNTLEVSVQEDGTMRLRNPPDVVWRRR